MVLKLKKVESRSWEREIKANGLDQTEDEEEEAAGNYMFTALMLCVVYTVYLVVYTV